MIFVDNVHGESVDVTLQDQHTPTMIVRFNQLHDGTLLTNDTAIFDDTITVDDPTGFVVGTYIVIFDAGINRYYVGNVLDVTGNVITLDTPLDAPFPATSQVGAAITDMSVDGSVTRQVFGLRGAGLPTAIKTTVDITRIIFYCLCDSSVDLSKFGNITALTRGLVLRKRDGTINNIFNVKSNGEIDGITLDWNAYSASNPQQGQNGFTARLTFSGQDKMGVVVRLPPGEDLEFVVQDDLLGLTLLQVTAEGSEVLDD